VHSAENCEALGEVQILKQACMPKNTHARILLAAGHLFPMGTFFRAVGIGDTSIVSVSSRSYSSLFD
jgi:hypothetical protein